MKIRVGAFTDVGQARERNEDSYLVEHPLYAVADGVGGHRGGAVASSLAVEVLSGTDGASDLADGIRRANQAVFERQAGDRSLAGMGTTVTAVVAEGTTLRLGHVGDSRAYLLRGGELRQLTDDHTLVQRMVDEGRISSEEAHVHPQRNIVTRVVGVDEELDVDEFDVPVQEGDRIVLCTDGLTAMMREESIQEILEGAPDPQEAAEKLVDAANRAGGLDNITVMVLDFSPGDGVEILARETGAKRNGRAEVGAHPLPARRLRRVLNWGGLVVVVVVAGLIGLRVWADRHWYVGVQNGHVAVYRGFPTEFLFIDLSHPVRETGIDASDAEKLALFRDIEDGITSDSREKAQDIVDQIRTDLKALEREQSRTQPKKAGGA